MLFTSYDSACVNAFCNRDPMDLRGCKTMSDFQKEKMISCRIPMNRCNMAQVRFLFIKRFTSELKYLFGFFYSCRIYFSKYRKTVITYKLYGTGRVVYRVKRSVVWYNLYFSQFLKCLNFGLQFGSQVILSEYLCLQVLIRF